MIHHTEFHNDISNKIVLWFNENKLVALTTYDHSLGESFFVTDDKHKFLKEDLLKYSIENHIYENSLGIGINDVDEESTKLLKNYGFAINENEENVLEINLEISSLEYVIPHDITISNVNNIEDVFNYNKVLWYGMDHKGNLPEDEKTISKYRKILSAPHNNWYLNIIAKEGDNWAAFCSCWYDKDTDYAYVEPVCTVPEYRGIGLGKAVVLESLKRCK